MKNKKYNKIQITHYSGSWQVATATATSHGINHTNTMLLRHLYKMIL